MADGTSSGESSFFHTTLDMTHVDAPSSMNCDVLILKWYLKGYQSEVGVVLRYLNKRRLFGYQLGRLPPRWKARICIVMDRFGGPPTHTWLQETMLSDQPECNYGLD
jgi:hypothetical protein